MASERRICSVAVREVSVHFVVPQPNTAMQHGIAIANRNHMARLIDPLNRQYSS
jgi:hypothetical protein